MLVERDDALASLTALLEETAAGQGRLVFLGGEAGVGKTALTTAFAAAAAGHRVRRGACDNVTTAAALGPLADAVPELTELMQDEAGVNRLQLFRRLRSVLSAGPTLLLLEDTHWADEATLELVRFLGRRLEGVPLLVVATFREDEVDRDHPLTVVLGDLATSYGVRRMHLAPLTPAGVQRLVAEAGSMLDAAELHVRSGGNAFCVTEVLAAGTLEVPPTVRDAVLARASRLSADGREVLAAAAVLGRADLRLLVAVSGRPAEAVDECVRRGVLVPAEDGVGDADREGLMFRHELARVAVESSLTPGRRTALHQTALRALGAAGVPDHRRLAHHAAGAGEGAQVLEHAPRAAASAARLGAHRQAADQYRLALRFHDRPDVGRAELLAALSYECYLTDQLADARDARLEEMHLAERSGATVALGTAQRWLSRLSWFLGLNEDSERYAAAAVATLEPLGDGPELAMAYSNLAQLRMLSWNVPEAVTWGERAIALARRIGDHEAEIHALNNVGTAMATGDSLLEGLQRLTRSLDLALVADAHEHAARAYTNLGSACLTQRRLTDSERHLRAGIAYCTERDLDSWSLYMSAELSRCLCEQGRLEEALACATKVLEHPHLSAVSQIPAAVVVGQVAVRRGAEPGAWLDDALELATGTGESQRLVPVAVARAEAAWVAGSTDQVVAEVDHAWDIALAHPQSWDLGELSWWLSVAGVRRETPVPVAVPFALMLDGAFREAAQVWRSTGCPLWSAYALAASPDLADARLAFETVDDLGLPQVRAALARDRRLRGLAVPRGPRVPQEPNAFGLTAREAEVLALLVDGLSNADMAHRLFLSEKTVGHHVSAVLRKLGQPSRSRAVAAALRHRAGTPT